MIEYLIVVNKRHKVKTHGYSIVVRDHVKNRFIFVAGIFANEGTIVYNTPEAQSNREWFAKFLDEWIILETFKHDSLYGLMFPLLI